MTPRTRFTATLTEGAGNAPVSSAVTFAMNSGIRASEQLVREYARKLGHVFYGEMPTREGDVYQRVWSGQGVTVTVTVCPASD